MGAQLVHLLLELRDVDSKQVIPQTQPPDPWIVAVETAFEVSGDQRQAAIFARHHPDRIQLQRRHALMVHQFPELGQLLHQRRGDLFRRVDLGECIGDHKGLELGQRVEGH